MYTICYADNRTENLNAAKHFFESNSGYAVKTTQTISGGLQILATTTCDAVVSGNHLADGDGTTFLQEVRAQYGAMPFILFSDALKMDTVVKGPALNHTRNFFLQTDGDTEVLFPELMQNVRQLITKTETEEINKADAKRLHTVQKLLNAGVFEINAKTNTIWLSENASCIFGLSRPHDGTFSLADIPACIPDWERVFRDLTISKEYGDTFRIEFGINPADGSKAKHILSAGRVVSEPPGGPTTIIGIIRDITERRSREVAFRTMVKNIVAPIGLESLDRITESVATWLDADCVMIGEITPDNEHVRTLSMILDGEHISDFTYTLKGSPCQNVTEKGYCIYLKNAVSLFPTAKDMVELNAQGYVGTAMRNIDGQVIGILCVLTRRPILAPPNLQEIIDLIAIKASAEIERKRSEEVIKKSKQALANAMDLAHLVNWDFDARTQIFTFDDRFYNLYGTTAEREGGTQMSAEDYARNFVHPDDLEVVRDEVKKALDATNPGFISRREHRIVRRDGEIRHIVVRFGIVKDKYGTTIETHGANQDITELKHAEQALLQANHKVSLLSAITRHDILNQIQATGFLLDIAKDESQNASATGTIDTLHDVTQTIESLIQFTRVYEELGTHKPQWQQLDTVFQQIPLTKRVKIQTDTHGIEVYADPILGKVFYNLMDNSVQHGERVTEIRVFAQETDKGAVIVWEDNGIGVQAENKQKIFTRGYGENTGFGLFLICEILAITGMTIAETGIPGEGARFEITVPNHAYRFA